MSQLVNKKKENNTTTLTFSRMLNNLADLKELDLKDEYQAACALLFTLAAFEKDETAGTEMFEYINGPEDMSGFDVSFIRNQFAQYPYVARSYFSGTSPENNYAVEGVKLSFKETPYSRTEDNYVQLAVHSSGADNDRMFKLRKKPSTGEWFLFSDTYKGLLAGIRTPKAEDKWA